MTSNYTLSEVCAGAYRSNNPAQFLVHAVGHDGAALCRRVKPDNLAGYVAAEHKAPTCQVCLRKWKR